jgi:hypothetical protein
MLGLTSTAQTAGLEGEGLPFRLVPLVVRENQVRVLTVGILLERTGVEREEVEPRALARICRAPVTLVMVV